MDAVYKHTSCFKIIICTNFYYYLVDYCELLFVSVGFWVYLLLFTANMFCYYY